MGDLKIENLKVKYLSVKESKYGKTIYYFKTKNFNDKKINDIFKITKNNLLSNLYIPFFKNDDDDYYVFKITDKFCNIKHIELLESSEFIEVNVELKYFYIEKEGLKGYYASDMSLNKNFY